MTEPNCLEALLRDSPPDSPKAGNGYSNGLFPLSNGHSNGESVSVSFTTGDSNTDSNGDSNTDSNTAVSASRVEVTSVSQTSVSQPTDGSPRDAASGASVDRFPSPNVLTRVSVAPDDNTSKGEAILATQVSAPAPSDEPMASEPVLSSHDQPDLSSGQTPALGVQIGSTCVSKEKGPWDELNPMEFALKFRNMTPSLLVLKAIETLPEEVRLKDNSMGMRMAAIISTSLAPGAEWKSLLMQMAASLPFGENSPYSLQNVSHILVASEALDLSVASNPALGAGPSSSASSGVDTSSSTSIPVSTSVPAPHGMGEPEPEQPSSPELSRLWNKTPIWVNCDAFSKSKQQSIIEVKAKCEILRDELGEMEAAKEKWDASAAGKACTKEALEAKQIALRKTAGQLEAAKARVSQLQNDVSKLRAGLQITEDSYKAAEASDNKIKIHAMKLKETYEEYQKQRNVVYEHINKATLEVRTLYNNGETPAETDIVKDTANRAIPNCRAARSHFLSKVDEGTAKRKTALEAEKNKKMAPKAKRPKVRYPPPLSKGAKAHSRPLPALAVGSFLGAGVVRRMAHSHAPDSAPQLAPMHRARVHVSKHERPCARLGMQSYSEGQVPLRWVPSIHNVDRVISLEHVARSVAYVWAIPIRELNRLYHALHGNGIMKKMYTSGMPTLSKESTTAEQFILWFIDYRGWCTITGALSAIIGPLPQNISDADRDEGLQYLCAAIEDKNLKHALASKAGVNGAGGAPEAMEWLHEEFLQGVEFQPALNAILDHMSLGAKESLVAFKARFMKISDVIQPALPPAILCQKFNVSIKRQSGNMFDDCITTSTAVSGFDDFEAYSKKLTLLCSQKRALGQSSSQDNQINALTTRMDALASEMKKARSGPRDDRDRGKNRDRGKDKYTPGKPFDKGGGKGKRVCFNCGKMHEGKCTAPPAKCDFILPNGERCNKQHLRKFCFYEDPSRCQDPRVREIITKKLEAMKTGSMAGNPAHIDTFETFCTYIEDDESVPGGSVDPTNDLNINRLSPMSPLDLLAEEKLNEEPEPLHESEIDIPGLDLFASHQLLELARGAIYIGLDPPEVENIIGNLIENTWGAEFVLSGTRPLCAALHIADMISYFCPENESESTYLPEILAEGYGISTVSLWEWKTRYLNLRIQIQQAFGEDPEDSFLQLHPVSRIIAKIYPGMDMRLGPYAPRLSPVTPPPSRPAPEVDTPPAAPGAPARSGGGCNDLHTYVTDIGGRLAVQHTLPAKSYVVKWRRWILNHLLFGITAGESALPEEIISLVTDYTIAAETSGPRPEWNYVHERRAVMRVSMQSSGYKEKDIDLFLVTAYPTKIEKPLDGAEEMFEARKSMDLFQSSMAPSQHEQSNCHFVVDTGATGHLVNDRRLIDASAHKPYRVRIRTGLGECFSESIGPVTFEVADNNGSKISITRTAVFCPKFSVNLFSPAADFSLHNTRVDFNDKLTLTLSDGTIIPFSSIDGSYRLPYSVCDLQAHVSITDPATLWHLRMGHPPYSVIQKLPSTTIGPTFTLTDTDAKSLGSACEVCPHARMKALPYARSTGVKLATAFGDCIHMDLVGPLPASNPHGYKYGSLFVDQYSLHYGGYCLRTKSEHESIHKSYCSDMSSYGGMSIKEFHSDNGGEFTSNSYSELIRESGALKTTTVARTPNQNAYAEGAFWKIFCVVRAVLEHSGLPHNLWPYAYLFACYVLNRTPRVGRGNDVVTSYELLNKRKPNLAHVKIFGCVAHAVKDKTERGSKLNSVSVTGIHLGPARYQRGWILWIPGENRFVVARNVRFEETIFYKDSSHVARAVSTAPAEDGSDEEDDNVAPQAVNQVPPNPRLMCETPGCTLHRHHLGNHTTEQPATGAGLPSANLRKRAASGATAGVAAAPAADQPPVAPTEGTANEGYMHHYMPTRVPVAFEDILDMPIDSMLNWEPPMDVMMADIYDQSPTKDDVEAYVSIKESRLMKDEDGNFKSVTIPKGYHQARYSSEFDKWKEAMDEEIKSHDKAGTWELVLASEAPRGRRPIGSTWSYDVKRNADGTVNRYKARFCAQGFSQIEGYDYYHTYSNTVRMDTLRLLLATAAAESYFLTGADIKTAYLNGKLDEDIYMRQPQGFEKEGPNGEPMVCKLKKSIYGLKQSGACWERRLVQELSAIGFTRCEADPCLYKLEQKGATLFMTTYVDDLLFASSNLKIRENVMSSLNKVFEVKDTGVLTWFLNTAIRHERTQRRIEIDQSLYIEDIMQTFLPNEVGKTRKWPSLPCTEQILSLKADLPPEQFDPRYRSGVGKLNWLVTMTRFDLAFAVSTLARFNNCGGAPHMEMLLNTVRYAYGTRHYKLVYGIGGSKSIFDNFKLYSKVPDVLFSEGTMTFMTDASHGGEKPMAGYVGIIHGGPFAWSGYRLPQTSLSSCDAEYCAATTTVTTIVSVRPVINFLQGRKLKEPTILFCDNIAAVLLSENNTSSRRLKHIATRIAYLRESVQSGEVQMHHIATNGNIADLFTKPLGATQFHYLRRLLMA